MNQAFQGPNGWYVAWVQQDGSHYQPAGGDRLTEGQAKRRARELNERVDDLLDDITSGDL